MKRSSKKFLFPLIALTGIFYSGRALAFCPICTVAIGAGVGLSRWLGINDLISGTWIGGFIVSMIFWALDWLEKKQIRFRFRSMVISILLYAITILPLCFSNIIGHPYNTFCGIDRLLFGIGIGSLVFLASAWLNNFLKKKNNGKVFFNYQKVILPLLLLLLASLIIYLTAC